MKETPDFFQLLSDADKAGYIGLKTIVSSNGTRYNRNQRIVTFAKNMDDIRYYCEVTPDQSSLRCLACGVCWLGSDVIAVNTHQLRLLIGKSKSSINGVLAKMGYTTPIQKDADDATIMDRLPLLTTSHHQMRRWTIRRKAHPPPAPASMDRYAILEPWEHRSSEWGNDDSEIWEWPENSEHPMNERESEWPFR
jgi:hypothetical protein